LSVLTIVHLSTIENMFVLIFAGKRLLKTIYEWPAV
jgi:hypothetical protein